MWKENTLNMRHCFFFCLFFFSYNWPGHELLCPPGGCSPQMTPLEFTLSLCTFFLLFSTGTKNGCKKIWFVWAFVCLLKMNAWKNSWCLLELMVLRGSNSWDGELLVSSLGRQQTINSAIDGGKKKKKKHKTFKVKKMQWRQKRLTQTEKAFFTHRICILHLLWCADSLHKHSQTCSLSVWSQSASVMSCIPNRHPSAQIL